MDRRFPNCQGPAESTDLAASDSPAKPASQNPMKTLWQTIYLVSACMMCSCATTEHATSPGKGGTKYFTIAGMIDGSEQFVFTQNKITWTHKSWGKPEDMMFGGQSWPELTQTPKEWLAAGKLDLSKARITKREGRDTIALEITPDGFVLYLADAPNGAGFYSVTIAVPAAVR